MHGDCCHSEKDSHSQKIAMKIVAQRRRRKPKIYSSFSSFSFFGAGGADGFSPVDSMNFPMTSLVNSRSSSKDLAGAAFIAVEETRDCAGAKAEAIGRRSRAAIESFIVASTGCIVAM